MITPSNKTAKKPSKQTKNNSPVSHAHDKAFKSAMSDLRVARDFFQHHLPTNLQEKLDLSTLRLHHTTFIDPELRQLMTDMLCSVDFKDQSGNAFCTY